MKARLKQLLEDAGNASVLVIGDVMLDEYIIGDSRRISPEAPEPVIEESERLAVPGGAANVAVNVTAMGGTARLISVVGDDDDAASMRRELIALGVAVDGLITDPSRPTTRKTRMIARGTQVLRVDREHTGPINAALEQQLAEAVIAAPEEVVVVSDYAKGVVAPGLIQRITAAGKRVIVDPKSRDFTTYAGAFLITPNRAELATAADSDCADLMETECAGRKIMDAAGIAHLLVTLGPEGMLLIDRDGAADHIHTRAREVYDVTGAGDTVIASIAAATAAGATLADACHLATIAAGIVVGKHRTATATPAEIMDYAFGQSAADKIVTRDTLREQIKELKHAGRRIVFTNGCFDLMHIGHITYLNDARALGDVLVIGLNTDDSVRRLKGPLRPIIPESERSHVLAALECVDFVVLFDDDTPRDLITEVRPDILAKGEDYTVEEVVGHDIVSEYGGEVRLIPLVGGVSTSTIIERIRERDGGE
jgi:D-beta-D-heptose 7-phosphate kinase / D-beta-D-heptose 1-phosphate adenosyltransferase